ncbi:hypothetical protein [Bogoriella caseilytica]|uniref:Uncharacterized protein n=1 Tax=Bogoriella caseilytica TaxID=56055 RepID=A0A3N2BFW7_9MICO|nr:hypothetical protein [Bogoriella caseilytica]ROR74115.1 hypothetical protein EDD31_2513 [Bogoriella caseilytica]
MILRRGARLPEHLREHLSDRSHALAELQHGSWSAVTARALVILTTVEGGEVEVSSAAWHELEHGSWDGEEGVLTLTWIDRARPQLVLTPAHERVEAFTAAVRERIQSSVVHTEHGTTPSGASIRAYIRRDDRGELLSQVTATGRLGTDPSEAEVVDEVERRAREAVGLPT